MPSQQEVKWSQLRIGLIVIVSIVLLTTLLFLITSEKGGDIFSPKLTVFSYFDNAGGLQAGAPVGLQGVTIGSVKAVRIVSDPARKKTPVEVIMRIDGKFGNRIRTDTIATLSSANPLSDTTVDLDSEAATGPPIQNRAELKAVSTPGLADIIKSSEGTVASVNQITSKLNAMLDGLQQGHGTVGQLLANPELYNKLNASVDELHRLTVKLNTPDGTAGKLLNDNNLYDRLSDTAGRLDQIATDLQSGKGTAGKLLTDETLYNNLNSTVAHANSLLAEADAGRGGLGLLAKNPQFAAKLDDTVTQVNTLVTSLNSGKGTLGKLATDDTAYTNLNKLLTESTSLVTTIRSDPKKYLTIHLKIF
jgi:phospholipid/cholesterol/gamma-HCH transport system substrate-binding protein